MTLCSLKSGVMQGLQQRKASRLLLESYLCSHAHWGGVICLIGHQPTDAEAHPGHRDILDMYSRQQQQHMRSTIYL
jgi:hypothetical protein